jgi:hypothetical protein
MLMSRRCALTKQNVGVTGELRALVWRVCPDEESEFVAGGRGFSNGIALLRLISIL